MSMSTRLAVVAVGTEVTEGRIANTNAAWISRRFLRAGIETACHVAVPDDPAGIERALRRAAESAGPGGIVVVTGGLGPTLDDITRDVAAALAGAPLEEDRATVEWIEEIFRRRGPATGGGSEAREAPPNNRRQALFPRGATILPNPNGTAPGFRMEIEGARFFFVPGVPRESERMLEESVLPGIERESAAAGRVVLSRRLNCFGVAESRLDALLAPLFPGPDPALAFNVSKGTIEVRLTSRAPAGGRAEAEARLEAAAARARAAVGPAIFSEGETSIEEAALDALRARRLTLGLAESCTGGLAAARLARVAGASDALAGGIVAYSNDVKRRALGVPAETIERHGAVSRECALAMARGARRATGGDMCVAVTGIAGPSGGTPEKPVGLVWIALVSDQIERARELRLRGERAWIQLLAALAAIDEARRAALGLPPPE